MQINHIGQTMTHASSQPARTAAFSRRAFIVLGAFSLAGCVTQPRRDGALPSSARALSPEYLEIYGPKQDGSVLIPAVDVSEIDPRFLRQSVAYTGPHMPGTIVVDPHERFLYLVQPGGRAMRYGIGVGKEGLEFKGDAIVQRAARWPRWTPTTSMIAREPQRYGPYSAGLPGGLENPLGARALYLYRNGRDTLYRLHGTNEPMTIGQAVSSGCIRLFNQDIIDLYNRTAIGSRVVVL